MVLTSDYKANLSACSITYDVVTPCYPTLYFRNRFLPAVVPGGVPPLSPNIARNTRNNIEISNTYD